jgi:hypothetical protein
MQKRIPITIKHRNEKDGQLVFIPIRGTEEQFCKMHNDDFELLLSLGVHPLFRLKQGTLWCRCNYRNIGVARLLCNCQAGENVRYLNADPTDLRSSNLLKLPGMAKYAARSHMKKTYPTQQYEIEHVYEDRAESRQPRH